jgi:outer membrane murein-binding lipoprotein Lpp
MATGRSRNLAPWLILAALMPLGCAQPGPFTSRQTMVGSLKASVSQLEFENEKLRKDVAELKADNARLDTQLAQEIDANGEMSARLDDAKDLIRRQTGTAQALGAPTKNFEDDSVPPPASTPRTRTTRGGRKPPAANIPRIEPVTPFGSGSNSDDLGYQPSTKTPRDLGPLDQDDEDRWLPVARGLGSQVR